MKFSQLYEDIHLKNEYDKLNKEIDTIRTGSEASQLANKFDIHKFVNRYILPSDVEANKDYFDKLKKQVIENRKIYYAISEIARKNLTPHNYSQIIDHIYEFEHKMNVCAIQMNNNRHHESELAKKDADSIYHDIILFVLHQKENPDFKINNFFNDRDVVRKKYKEL